MSKVTRKVDNRPANDSMAVMAITITRGSTRFVANMDEIPVNATIRMAGVHWNERP